MSRDNGNNNRGNTLAAQAAFDRELIRIAQTLYRVDKILDGQWDDGRLVTRISVTLPTSTKPGFLAVVTAEEDGENQVAFHGAESFVEALVGVLNRLENKSIKWKEDQWKNK